MHPSELQSLISNELERKINMIIENRLQEWFNSNIKQIVHDEIKEQFSKMMIIKFGEK